MKTQNALLGALPIIAKMLGQQLGVEVVIGASQACTDGKTIYLPSLPADSESLAILANGYIDHEAAHIRFTDFTVEKPPGLPGEFLNLLEDIRIERALGTRYPGSRHNLAALTGYLEQLDPSQPASQAPIADQVFAALYALLRARVLDQVALEPVAQTMIKRLEERLPEGALVKLLALAFEVRKTTSTSEVLALAQRIVAMLQDEAKQAPAPNGKGGSAQESGVAPEPSPSSGNNPSTSLPEPGTAKNALASAAIAAAGKHATNPSEVATDESGLQAQGNASTPSAVDRYTALQALLAASAGTAPDVGEHVRQRLNSAVRQDRLRVELAELACPPVNRDALKCCCEARAGTAALRRRLTTLVQVSRAADRWRSCRGRLDPRQLYRVGLNDPRVFVRQHEHPAPNTAVAVLLDRSSSMDAQMQLANQAVLATLLALDEIDGVASWAAAFPGHTRSHVVPLKRFEEHTQRVAGRFQIDAHGSTPLASALWRAAFELCQRSEPRRLLIVATDGKPSNVPACLDLIVRARASGIEVLGLGIGLSLEHVAAVFGSRDAVAIQTIRDLAPALFDVLERKLLAA
ncbi:MAG: VWA domain-containing protein [Candidatus Competibacteraceae bacterium]|nr:VWA domain-containing protein [Candidatus Competibacteraceae bacterium]MCB1803735.1 VWA domain-containing protein [Candidatus Competibacteraceae bacterium]MCB1810168.1 VWA domain-containing protein [Candidatus Competibacteraceae bacterium]